MKRQSVDSVVSAEVSCRAIPSSSPPPPRPRPPPPRPTLPPPDGRPPRRRRSQSVRSIELATKGGTSFVTTAKLEVFAIHRRGFTRPSRGACYFGKLEKRTRYFKVYTNESMHSNLSVDSHSPHHHSRENALDRSSCSRSVCRISLLFSHSHSDINAEAILT